MAEDKAQATAPKHEAKASDEDLAARVRDLESALKASRAALPLSLIPEHGAGPGHEVFPTWSQAEQEQAQAAEVEPLEVSGTARARPRDE